MSFLMGSVENKHYLVSERKRQLFHFGSNCTLTVSNHKATDRKGMQL